MDPSQYSEPCYPTYNVLGSLQSHAPDFDLEPDQLFDQYTRSFASHHAPESHPTGMLPTQHATVYNPVGTFPARDHWHQLPLGHGPLVNDRLSGPTGIFSIQPQRPYLSYAEKIIQTIQSDPTSERNNGQEWPLASQPIPRGLVPQETYKPTRHQAAFAGLNTVDFVVDGVEGIRLSDASEGNWKGFEGRDDRSLFEGDRLQIIIRLHLVGCSPWQSKIPTTDFTAKRRPITRMRLAAEMAKTMRKFIAREKLNGHEGSHPRCGWGDVSLENVILIRIVRVSAASWQPEIFVERQSVASQVEPSSSSS